MNEDNPNSVVKDGLGLNYLVYMKNNIHTFYMSSTPCINNNVKGKLQLLKETYCQL